MRKYNRTPRNFSTRTSSRHQFFTRPLFLNDSFIIAQTNSRNSPTKNMHDYGIPQENNTNNFLKKLRAVLLSKTFCADLFNATQDINKKPSKNTNKNHSPSIINMNVYDLQKPNKKAKSRSNYISITKGNTPRNENFMSIHKAYAKKQESHQNMNSSPPNKITSFINYEKTITDLDISQIKKRPDRRRILIKHNKNASYHYANKLKIIDTGNLLDLDKTVIGIRLSNIKNTPFPKIIENVLPNNKKQTKVELIIENAKQIDQISIPEHSARNTYNTGLSPRLTDKIKQGNELEQSPSNALILPKFNQVDNSTHIKLLKNQSPNLLSKQNFPERISRSKERKDNFYKLPAINLIFP